MKSIALVALVLAASASGACQKKTRSACDESIGGVLGRALAHDPDDSAPVPNPIDTLKTRLETTLDKLCMDEKWSTDVLSCLDDAGDPGAAKKCEAMLTPAQQDKLEKSMGEVMGLPIAEKK